MYSLTRKVLAVVLFLCISVVLVTASENATTKKQKKDPSKEQKEEGINWTSYDIGLARAKKEDKHVFIDFSTKWCGWCKKMDKETFSDSEVIEMLNTYFVPVKVDGDSKKELNIDGYKITEKNLTSREFGVRGYPTFWFLKSDGSKLGAINGYKPKETMMEALKFVKEYKYDTTRTQTPQEKNK